MKIRTLHINAEKNWGGGEAQVKYLLNYLRLQGHETALACRRNSAIHTLSKKEGYVVFPLEMRNGFDISSILKLKKIMQSYKPDIVHMHTSRAHLLGTLALLLIRHKPIQLVTRRMDYPIKQAAVMRFFYTCMDRVIAISPGVKTALMQSGLPEEKIELIYSGVDLEKFNNPPDRISVRKKYALPYNPPIIAIVATMPERKGHIYLLNAMPDILKEFPQTILLVVGDGRRRPQLEELSNQLNLGSNVNFMGWVKNTAELYYGLDLLVMPSLAEGLGVSILEGLAAGLPVVGTKVGGIPDVIQDGKTGYLIPPKDSRAISDMVIKVLRDLPHAQDIGKAGRALVEEKFSALSMSKGNEALYIRLLTEKGIISDK